MLSKAQLTTDNDIDDDDVHGVVESNSIMQHHQSGPVRRPFADPAQTLWKTRSLRLATSSVTIRCTESARQDTKEWQSWARLAS